MFSPERAEHDYYQLQTQLNTATAGQVVINELLASNSNNMINEYGNHADWIELFNKTNTPLSLGGLYLTDDINNFTKYSFPVTTIIQPQGYLIVWADQQASTATYLHCNFKLSAGGEKLLLSDGTSLIDSLTFGNQSTDISLGRCPNGTGPFVSITPPTFGIKNCNLVNIFEVDGMDKIVIYPNPSHDEMHYQYSSSTSLKQIVLLNSIGQVIQTIIPADDQHIGSELTSGLYHVVFRFDDGNDYYRKWVKLF